MNTTLTPKNERLSQEPWMNQPATGPRFMMWVDGVGGYLVCLSESVRIGQAVRESRVELPLVGDVSRHHATILRQGDGYSLEPFAGVAICGNTVVGRRHLSDGDVLELGRSTRIRFRQPHPLSASARLEWASHHRCQPAADGVLLMASSCILGPATGNHVVCRTWENDVVLVRQGQTLTCHSNQPFEVDGVACEGRAPVTLDSRIQGQDFCISLERFD
ncbi:MAG: FHA domain-containing protein [Planctomycetales bacterium]|nr:FHA domain-containing protein [Planctomycetales bacterium]